MKVYIKFNLPVLFWIVSTLSAQAQQTWHFEDTLFRSVGKKQQSVRLSFNGRTNRPELVQGIQGQGLRTDGYSVWLNGQLPAAQHPERLVDAYFALETFPTDTAGFFAVKTQNRWLSAAVDRFGQLFICMRSNGATTYYPAIRRVGRFQWLHLSLRVGLQKAELRLDDQLIKTVALPWAVNSRGRDSLLIGRDPRDKRIGIFPVTAINGIIDELSVSDDPATRSLRSIASKQPPILAIPASRFENDFLRPKYHLLPAANWTNETHGLIFYRGLYHVFNQKNGANLFLGQINWGHYTSPDLITWTEQKPALTPEPGYDENGIWSGCIVNDNQGKPMIFYSAGGAAGINVSAAFPADESLKTWRKFIGNPVINANPQSFARNDFHDPIVWKENGNWYMGVGFGLRDHGVEAGTILLYRSKDLKNWEYLHPLFTGDPEHDDSGVFWEMPLFYKLNGKYILLVNKVPVRGKPAAALYWTGEFINEKFVPDDKQPRRLEIINRLLSPSVAKDAQGNTTAIAIIPDETSARETYQRGWTHLYSIPRIWTLENGKIRQRPHPALTRLRGQRTEIAPGSIEPPSPRVISEGTSQVEIELELTPGKAGKFGLVIGKDPDGSEQTRIYFDVGRGELVVDQSRSSLRNAVPLQVRSGSCRVLPGKTLTLRLFIDGSVVEGFINDQDAFTTRIFPLHAESNRVELFTEDGTLGITRGVTWQMKSSENKTAF